MIKFVGYLLLLFPFAASALVPVEGILMGEAPSDIQTDPLLKIFSDIYDKSKEGENRKIKLYQGTFENGQGLVESCSYLDQSKYSTPWEEKQARRSMAATLQYIGLDTSIKAIGAYAQKLEVSEDEFKKLSKNLINNYCSKNITIFSLRNLEKSLSYYYQNPQTNLIPSIETSPFATAMVKTITEKTSARSKEFDLAIRNFRAFCSWGGEVEDYRMLTPYLKNPFIMSFVIKNMLGIQNTVDVKQKKVISVPADSTVQVICTDLICRKEGLNTFKVKYPRSVGSTGILTDLQKNYCHHFRYQDTSQVTNRESRAWIKSMELEDPILETSQFIALMTGVPDFFNGVETYREIPLLVRSSVDERWTLWARRVLNSFSKDLLYEESIKIRVDPRRDLAALAERGFQVDFNVSLGEMDRLMKDEDKLDLTFELKLSKNYLRQMKVKWQILERDIDMEGQKLFREEVARYIDLQLENKEKLFTQKMWNSEFSKLIADELLQQTLKYQGPLFDSYQDEVLKIPVKFSYGIFAISYLRYKADVAAGRLKLNL